MNRKRKREDSCEHVPQKLYGIVTDGTQWVFLRLEGEGVEVHMGAPFLVHLSSLDTNKDRSILREDIKALFGYILGIYQLAIEDSTSRPKRARVAVSVGWWEKKGGEGIQVYRISAT